MTAPRRCAWVVRGGNGAATLWVHDAPALCARGPRCFSGPLALSTTAIAVEGSHLWLKSRRARPHQHVAVADQVAPVQAGEEGRALFHGASLGRRGDANGPEPLLAITHSVSESSRSAVTPQSRRLVWPRGNQLGEAIAAIVETEDSLPVGSGLSIGRQLRSQTFRAAKSTRQL
jgi:hypothetical protein